MSCKCINNCPCKSTPVVDWTKPIQTKDGLKARVLAKDLKGPCPICVAIQGEEKQEYVSIRTLEGQNLHGSYDLINAPDKVSGWLPLFKGARSFPDWHPSILFDTEEAAALFASAAPRVTSTYIGAVYIEKEIK